MEDRSAPRPGNLQRAEWRRKCRQILAEHLRTKLGVTIEPNQVRLRPELQDGYMWARQPEREHLFAKQLSKHSVGAYMELCREINVTIEAIPWLETKLKQSEVSLSQVDLNTQVEQLQAEIERLTKELSSEENKIRTEIDARQQAEERCQHCEEDLRAVQTRESNLKRENMHLSSRLRKLTRRLGRSDKEVKRALVVLQRSSDSRK